MTGVTPRPSPSVAEPTSVAQPVFLQKYANDSAAE